MIDRNPGPTDEYAGVARLPVEPYTSPRFYDTVRRCIFERCWLSIAMMREVPQDGELVKDVPTFGRRIVISRDGKDRVKGVQFDPNDPSVARTEINLDTWRGFIFATFAEQPKESLTTALGRFAERYEPFPFEKFSHKSRFTITLRCNWMVAVDSFQEAYHAAYLHGAWSNGKPKGGIIEYSFSGPNRSLVFSTPGRHPPTPIHAAVQRHGKSGVYASSESAPEPTININGHPNYMADINSIFPNLFVNMTSRNFWTHRFWPLSHRETFYETTYYDSPPQNYAEDVALNYNRSRVLAMLVEDFEMLERSQRGLQSGAIKEMITGAQEALVKHFSSVVTREVRAWGLASSDPRSGA